MIVPDKKLKDFQSIESRRNPRSGRRMTPLRRTIYFLGMPVLKALLKLGTSTYRVEAVLGAENIEKFLTSGTCCAPAYWHQHHVLCSTLINQWIKRGFNACFLVSASVDKTAIAEGLAKMIVDGEVPERIARSWGAEVIRGSANQTGALALRDMQGMMKRGYSIVTTADGPGGPKYEFKPGVILMARIGGVPILPIACAAERAWYLDRWDDFMIPKPFSRVVLAIGEPYTIPPDTPLDQIEPHRVNVQQAVMSLMRQSEKRLKTEIS